MDMKLCFGTFIKVLDLCKYNITQEDLVAEIVRIVDNPNSRYITEKDAISKLKNCKINYIFYSGNYDNIPSTEMIIQSIRKNVSPYIDEDKKATVMLMLLYIIQDESKKNTGKEEYFKQYFSSNRKQLLTQKDFLFPEFLGKVLLYTLYSGIDNRIGGECVKVLTEDFLNKKISPYKEDYHWNSSTETLTLSFREMFAIFDKALDDYSVREFIEKTDPINRIYDESVEDCEKFLNYIRDNIWVPFGKNSIGQMLQMVQSFAQILDDYITYLGTHMIPLVDNPSIFVPIHRDENPKWATDFANTVYDYRKQLITVYDKISRFMQFEIEN